jgi:hypothetical protein
MHFACTFKELYFQFLNFHFEAGSELTPTSKQLFAYASNSFFHKSRCILLKVQQLGEEWGIQLEQQR